MQRSTNKHTSSQQEDHFIHASDNTFGPLSTAIVTCRKQAIVTCRKQAIVTCRKQTRYDTTKQIMDVLYVRRKADISVLHKNSSRSRWPRGLRRGSGALRLLALWVRIPPGGWMCVSLVSVVCCQVEVSATGWSLVQRRPTECGVSECDRETSIIRRRPWPTGGCCAMREKIKTLYLFGNNKSTIPKKLLLKNSQSV